jgi:hypothetical protein
MKIIRKVINKTNYKHLWNYSEHIIYKDIDYVRYNSPDPDLTYYWFKSSKTSLSPEKNIMLEKEYQKLLRSEKLNRILND